MNDRFSEIQSKLMPVEQWLSNQTLEGIYSSAYWNDIEEEKKKEWWIADGNYTRCMDYLKRVGLLNEWAVVEKYISEFPSNNKLKVADLAAGIGWTSALFSRLDGVAEVHATEISKHRLSELFPYAVDMLDRCPEKIRRYIGSFYELGFDNESMDVVFMSQAFHHADKPLKLLMEIDRVLKPGGGVILMGESHVNFYRRIKGVVRMLLRKRKLSTNFFVNHSPDHDSGDHYYRISDYYLFFQLLGYQCDHVIGKNNSLVLRAIKKCL